MAPHGRLLVDQLAERCVDDAVTGLPKSEAEVNVVVGDRERAVEPAEGVEDLLADHHAGTGHRAVVAEHLGLAEVAGLIAGQEAEGVPSDPATESHDDAGVLHPPVGVQETAPDGADLGPLGLLDQCFQPPVGAAFDVGVQEQEVLALGDLGGMVVDRGPVEGFGVGHHPAPGILRQPVEHRPRLRFPAVVVDEDGFPVVVAGPFLQ